MKREAVFFSWQSDIKAAANRTLIEDALKSAALAIAKDSDLAIEPVVDRDTQGLSGSPDIRAAIFEKIEKASVFVADVTPIAVRTKTRADGSEDRRLCPNPNVMIELGYAITKVGWSRIVMVLNTAFGSIEELPFDLRGHRCETYESAVDAPERARARKELQRKLQIAIAECLTAGEQHPAKYPMQFDLRYTKEVIGQERHDYQLVLELKNRGEATVTNWLISVEMPARTLMPGMGYFDRVRSDDSHRARFRFKGESDNGYPIHPDETLTRAIPYHVDTAIVRDRVVFSELVVAKAYVDNKLVREISQRFEDLQNF